MRGTWSTETHESLCSIETRVILCYQLIVLFFALYGQYLFFAPVNHFSATLSEIFHHKIRKLNSKQNHHIKMDFYPIPMNFATIRKILKTCCSLFLKISHEYTTTVNTNTIPQKIAIRGKKSLCLNGEPTPSPSTTTADLTASGQLTALGIRQNPLSSPPPPLRIPIASAYPPSSLHRIPFFSPFPLSKRIKLSQLGCKSTKATLLRCTPNRTCRIKSMKNWKKGTDIDKSGDPCVLLVTLWQKNPIDLASSVWKKE